MQGTEKLGNGIQLATCQFNSPLGVAPLGVSSVVLVTTSYHFPLREAGRERKVGGGSASC